MIYPQSWFLRKNNRTGDIISLKDADKTINGGESSAFVELSSDNKSTYWVINH